MLADEGHLLLGVGREGVDRDDDRQAELGDVLNVGVQIDNALFERGQILGVQLGLGHAAVVLERAHGRDEHDAGGIQTGLAALDVEELFRTQVGAEAGLGDRDIGQLEGHAGGLHRVAAVGDVREGAAVHQAGGALEGLDEVGLDRVLHQGGHRALGLEVARVNRLARVVIGDQNIAEALLEVVEVGGQTQDGHDLGGDRDHEVILARHAVHLAAQTDRDVAQRAVVHVEHAGEDDPAGVDAQRVALLQVVVQHGAEQVVRRGDRVHIAGEVQVDVLHRDDLRPAAAGRAALDAEYRAEGGLAQGDHGVLAQLGHGLSQTDGRGGLALARRGRVDRGDEHQLAVRAILHALPRRSGDLGLVAAVQLELLLLQAGLGRDRGDRLHPAALGNFDIGHHIFLPPANRFVFLCGKKSSCVLIITPNFFRFNCFRIFLAFSSKT